MFDKVQGMQRSGENNAICSSGDKQSVRKVLRKESAATLFSEFFIERTRHEGTSVQNPVAPGKRSVSNGRNRHDQVLTA
jgi:hypothetical protein